MCHGAKRQAMQTAPPHHNTLVQQGASVHVEKAPAHRPTLTLRLAALTFIILALLAQGKVLWIDQWTLNALRLRDDSTWIPTWHAITHLGDPIVTATAALTATAWLAWRRDHVSALATACLTATTFFLVWSLKQLIDRPRPPNGHIEVASAAMPSGHATHATILYIGILWILIRHTRSPRIQIAIITGSSITLLIGLSRILLGVHYPLDVLTGWTLGALLVAGTATIIQHTETHSPPKPSQNTQPRTKS